MFFPYTTDAPVYYWPHGTVGLIVANVLIFFAVVFGVLPIDGPWFLRYGDGLHPLEWVGSLFMHANVAKNS